MISNVLSTGPLWATGKEILKCLTLVLLRFTASTRRTRTECEGNTKVIVRSVQDITGTDRDVQTLNWRSKRLVLARENVGFSVHETTICAGTVNDFWYANHVEAVFVIEGEGELLNKETGEVHQLGPGSLYLLDAHERHQLRTRSQMRTVCVFNPPVTGREVHDEHGVYPLLVEALPAGSGGEENGGGQH